MPRVDSRRGPTPPAALQHPDSPLADGFKRNPALTEEILGHTAQRRWGHAADLAGAYLFLASDAAAFVTGTVITVDGGYLLV